MQHAHYKTYTFMLHKYGKQPQSLVPILFEVKTGAWDLKYQMYLSVVNRSDLCSKALVLYCMFEGVR